MLVVFQFPISDARGFAAEPGLRLVLPDWPNPTTQIRPQFVHRFGPAVERHFRPDGACADEEKFCRAARALRLDDLGRRAVGPSAGPFRPKCAFRRLLPCDGQTFARVEVGLAHDPRKPPLAPLDAGGINTIVAGLCELPSRVPGGDGKAGVAPLLRQGPALARAYARATLPLAADPATTARAETLVEAGNPLVLVEVEAREAHFPEPPAGFAVVPKEKVLGQNVAFGRIRSRADVVDTWLIHRSEDGRADTRPLRLCLLRLHAEQEGLDLILKQQKRGRLDLGDEAKVGELNDYYNKKTRLINRAAWGQIDQSAILAAFDAADLVTPPATRQNLADRFDGAFRQVWKKVEEYQQRRAAARLVKVVNVEKGASIVEQNVTVGGTGNVVNVAEYMANVTNNVNNALAQAGADDGVKALVKQLTDQVKAIAEKADPKQTQKMGKSLEALTREMAQPEPDRAWYELSLKGLKEAAEAVGAIADPIIATVKKLIPLLLGA